MSFWCLQFSQKTNENNSTWGTIVVKSIFFIRFMGELKIPKRHFEINWPLGKTGYSEGAGFNFFKVFFCRVMIIGPTWRCQDEFLRHSKPKFRISFFCCFYAIYYLRKVFGLLNLMPWNALNFQIRLWIRV